LASNYGRKIVVFRNAVRTHTVDGNGHNSEKLSEVLVAEEVDVANKKWPKCIDSGLVDAERIKCSLSGMFTLSNAGGGFSNDVMRACRLAIRK